MTNRGGTGTGRGGLQRQIDDHSHPDYWSKEDHHRYEDRIAKQLEKLEVAIAALTVRVTLMLGALSLIAILLPVISPFIRAAFGLDVPSQQ
jgi:hypothetical protein